MDKDIKPMTCDELKEEIHQNGWKIDDTEILEKIYHFVRHIYELKQKEKQRKGSRWSHELQRENYKAAGQVWG